MIMLVICLEGPKQHCTLSLTYEQLATRGFFYSLPSAPTFTSVIGIYSVCQERFL
jgi:hypothetical protein